MIRRQINVVCVFAVLLQAPLGNAQLPAAAAPRCPARYAPDIALVTASARSRETKTRYTYCVRSTAIYQCLSYDRAGKVRQTRHTTTQHGTAFVFRHDKRGALLLTNEHVVEWPFVTAGTDDVDDVPAGCRRVTQTLRIVDNDDDTYAADDIELTRVVADAELDAAVLRAKLPTVEVPFTVGEGAALTVGVAVQARGFPLGAFQAVTVGKVINTQHHDTEQGWNHSDFVVDAPLSAGSSGTPVFAVSCQTGSYELVGVFHAAYKEGQALNVVVAIEQLIPMMRDLKVHKRTHEELSINAADRAKLIAQLGRGSEPLVMFGGHFLRVSTHANTLLWTLYGRSFPRSPAPLLRLEDVPGRGYGRLGRVWRGAEHLTLVPLDSGRLRPGDRRAIGDVLRTWRRHRARVDHLRDLEATPHLTRAAHDQLERLRARLKADAPSRRNRARWIRDLVGRLAKQAAPRTVPTSGATTAR